MTSLPFQLAGTSIRYPAPLSTPAQRLVVLITVTSVAIDAMAANVVAVASAVNVRLSCRRVSSGTTTVAGVPLLPPPQATSIALPANAVRRNVESRFMKGLQVISFLRGSRLRVHDPYRLIPFTDVWREGFYPAAVACGTVAIFDKEINTLKHVLKRVIRTSAQAGGLPFNTKGHATPQEKRQAPVKCACVANAA